MPLPADTKLYALVPAAGIGSRMEAALPKQYLSLHGKTVAEHTLSRLLSLAAIQEIVVATAATDLWWPQLALAHHPRVKSALGGATRAHSVLAGLEFLSDSAQDSDWVLVHDMARPCVRLSDIQLLLEAASPAGAILALPVTDTVKQARPDTTAIHSTVPREHLWRALTPQLFPIGLLREALRNALAKNLEVTDEASAVELQGYQPVLVPGQPDNIKITVAADLPLARFYLQQQGESL